MIILKVLYWLVAITVFTRVGISCSDDERDIGMFFTNVIMSSLWIITVPIATWLDRHGYI